MLKRILNELSPRDAADIARGTLCPGHTRVPGAHAIISFVRTACTGAIVYRTESGIQIRPIVPVDEKKETRTRGHLTARATMVKAKRAKGKDKVVERDGGQVQEEDSSEAEEVRDEALKM